MTEERWTRRKFLTGTTGSAATGFMLGAKAFAMKPSPNETVTMGVIGAGIRGLEDMGTLLHVGGRVAAVCDLYDGHLRRAQEIQSNTPTTKDYREVLDRKDI